MKVKSLTVSGFRGFSGTETFDFDADAVIIVGVNGSGKTSIFDAILWALAGTVERLGGEQDQLVSKYSSSGEARAEVALQRADGLEVRVVRRFDGKSHLSVEVPSGSVRGPAAEAELLDALWPDAKAAAEPWDALSRSLTRAIYLQQDSVRAFVEADGEQGRFNVVGEIVGAGRVTELQRQLEASRNAWSRATNNASREIEPMQGQRAALVQRLQRLGVSAAQGEEIEQSWQAWREAAQEFVDDDFDGAGAQSAQSLDRALSSLQVREHHEERTAAAAEELVTHLAAPPPAADPVEPLQATVQQAEVAVESASERLARAQQSAAAERHRLVSLRDEAEALQAFAHLALQHLGDTCPVCEQQYEREATRARLEALASGAKATEAAALETDVQEIASELQAAESRLADARAALRQAEQAHRAIAGWRQTLGQLAQDVDLEVTDGLSAKVEQLMLASRSAVERMRALRAQGEQLNLKLAVAAEVRQRAELERQLESLDRQLLAREADLAARTETGELAGQLLAALRDASSSVVAAELGRIEPLLQRIYATVDPHPSFRAVRFLTRTIRGRGRLWTSLDDRSAGVSVDEPATVLSSSQLNVLAVTTFLSLNLAVDSLPLQLVALDDPLQSLDTVNLLGLADLLRRVKQSRQVIVSTHDERLAGLLSRKLRPVAGEDRTRVIKLEAWGREGPSVEQTDVPPDVSPLRLVV